MKKTWMLVFSTVVLATGCTTWQKPPEQALQALPLVKFGEPVPADQDFILYFPAGQPIPTQILIDGNIFQQPAHDTLAVALRQDLYVHKQWISYDRKSWVKGRNAFDFKIALKLPGYDNPKPGLVEINMNAKGAPAR